MPLMQLQHQNTGSRAIKRVQGMNDVHDKVEDEQRQLDYSKRMEATWTPREEELQKVNIEGQ